MNENLNNEEVVQTTSLPNQEPEQQVQQQQQQPQQQEPVQPPEFNAQQEKDDAMLTLARYGLQTSTSYGRNVEEIQKDREENGLGLSEAEKAKQYNDKWHSELNDEESGNTESTLYGQEENPLLNSDQAFTSRDIDKLSGDDKPDEEKSAFELSQEKLYQDYLDTKYKLTGETEPTITSQDIKDVISGKKSIKDFSAAEQDLLNQIKIRGRLSDNPNLRQISSAIRKAEYDQSMIKSQIDSELDVYKEATNADGALTTIAKSVGTGVRQGLAFFDTMLPESVRN